MSDSKLKFQFLNGALNLPQPFEENGSLMMNFLFKSDLKSLQTICDKWLNEPTNQELYYQPLAPIVQITFANAKKSYPSSEPYKDWGVIPYQEVIVSIFVLRVKKEGGIWIAEHVSALVPYIFVTDAIVMSTGREIYGMPKALGWIELPASLGEANKVFKLSSVSALHFERGVPFSKEQLLSITQTSQVSIPFTEEWQDIESAAKAIKKMMFGEGHIEIPRLKLIVEIAEILIEKKLPFTSLRQVRSIAEPENAVYKSVIEFNATALKINGGGRINGEFQLHMPGNDLFPMASDLGLSDGQVAEAAFWLDWDFVFGTGKAIWSTEQKPSLFKRLLHLFKL